MLELKDKYKYNTIMKFIFTIISISTILSTILSTIITTSNKPKFCVNCIHFRGNFFTSNKYGKCSLFPVIEKKDNGDYLVDGIFINPVVDYKYCSIIRNYDKMCGKDGNMYKEKNQWWLLGNKEECNE